MKEKSTTQAPISMIISLLLLLRPIAAHLITTPKDSEALIGNRTFFTCSSTNSPSQIYWYHYKIGVRENREIVYGFGEIHPSYKERFRVERNDATGESTLVIERVSIEDAGKFECQEDKGRGSSAFAQLCVLETIPICDWKIKNLQETGSGGDSTKKLLQLNCTVSFHGNSPPAMVWKRLGSNEEIKGVTQDKNSTQVTYTLEETDEFDWKLFQCETTKSVTTQYTCIPGPVGDGSQFTDSSSPQTANVTTIAIVAAVIISISVIFIVGLIGWKCRKKCCKASDGVVVTNENQDESNPMKVKELINVCEDRDARAKAPVQTKTPLQRPGKNQKKTHRCCCV